MQKSRVKTMLTAFFDGEDIIHHDLVPVKQVVNGKFYKEVIKREIARAHRVGLSFGKVAPDMFCTTLHRRILRALSPSSWRNERFPFIPSTLFP
jgi:hypothetical protein